VTVFRHKSVRIAISRHIKAQQTRAVRLGLTASPLQWIFAPQSGGNMTTLQSWVEASGPDGSQYWLDGLVVRFRDEAAGRRLLHLDQRSFSISGQVETADEDTYATFVVSKALSITVQVRAHAAEPDATSQEFTFINTEIDVLDLIFCAASPTTVH